MVLEGTYAKTLYRNERSGLTKFTIRPMDKKISVNRFGTVLCMGVTVPIIEGMPLRLEGKTEGAGEKAIFRCQNIREEYSNEQGLMTFLNNGNFEGIGPTTAKAILKLCNYDLSRLLEMNDVKGYLSRSVKGLTYEKAEVFVEKIHETTLLRNVFQYVMQFGGNYHDAEKLYQKYGSHTMYQLNKDPYQTGIGCGLPFAMCDAMAKTKGGTSCDKERLVAIAGLLAEECCESGDTYAYLTDVLRFINNYLVSEKSAFQKKMPPSVIQIGVSNNEKLAIDRKTSPARVYLKKLLIAENIIVRELKRLEQTSRKMNYSSLLVDKVEAQCGMKYAEPQKASFAALKRTGVKIVTGGPGTGKTTTIRGLISAYQMMYPDKVIKLCAPTGRAAQRMTESTGMEAVTIHRLLDYRPCGTDAVYKDATNPIEADLIVVDEMSMTDTELMSIFLQAVKDGTLVLLVGDIYQLPSVGPGDVLHDLIFSGKIPVFRLTKVYRQAGDSPIVTNANKINDGQTDLVENDDFRIITVKDDKELKDKILELAKQNYNPENLFDMQILAPSKKYEAGTKNLNKVIQEAVNPGNGGFVFGDTTYRVNDKIIMLNNNYSAGYFNGDVGHVKSIGSDYVIVDILGAEIKITRSLMEDMSLAYVVTVHKSQGSGASRSLLKR